MVKVNRKQLLNAVGKSLTSKSKRFILLKVLDNVLKVYSTNYEVYGSNDSYHTFYHNYLSISIDIIGGNNNELVALVDKYNLLKILGYIKSDEISLSLQTDSSKDYLVISNNKATYRLQSYNTESFIENIIDTNINNGIIINSKDLIDAIDRVMYTIYKAGFAYTINSENLNPNIFKSIGFIFENNSFFIVGTDNYRLAICDLKVLNNLNGRFIITKKAALSLKNTFNFKKDILFSIVEKDNGKLAVFKSDNIVFTTKIVTEMDYPDIFNIINEDKKHIAIGLKLSKKVKDTITNTFKSFIDKTEENKNDPIKLANFSKHHVIIVQLTLENKNLRILSLFDNSEINIPINYKGNKYEIELNALFLLEALENICGNSIVLKLPSKVECGIFIEPVGNCNCLALLMPIEVNYYNSDKNKT